MCAEFPSSRSYGDGWFNATPAAPDGTVLLDPDDWPAMIREHPRVALVDADTGALLSTWDRVACTDSIPGYQVPERTAEWEPGTTVVLDADTGEVLTGLPVD
jgi:hypothetical protein